MNPSDVKDAKDNLKDDLKFEDEDDDDFREEERSSDETLERIERVERRTDAPVDPADSELVARSFVVALDVETEAERAANPENEFLEHYRARTGVSLDADQGRHRVAREEAGHPERPSRVQTMRRIVRDGDLVGFGEDDPNEKQGLTVSRERLDGREIVSTRVSSIAGTRAAVDAAAAFFVDSSLEVGASFDIDARFDTPRRVWKRRRAAGRAVPLGAG